MHGSIPNVFSCVPPAGTQRVQEMLQRRAEEEAIDAHRAAVRRHRSQYPPRGPRHDEERNGEVEKTVARGGDDDHGDDGDVLWAGRRNVRRHGTLGEADHAMDLLPKAVAGPPRVLRLSMESDDVDGVARASSGEVERALDSGGNDADRGLDGRGKRGGFGQGPMPSGRARSRAHGKDEGRKDHGEGEAPILLVSRAEPRGVASAAA